MNVVKAKQPSSYIKAAPNYKPARSNQPRPDVYTVIRYTIFSRVQLQLVQRVQQSDWVE
jgi:hypothetical protein